MAKWHGSTGLAKNMSSVIDISSTSVNATIDHHGQPLENVPIRNGSTPATRFSSERCLPERTYELEENFPWCYKPADFFLWDRIPLIKWVKKYRPRTFLSDVIAGLTVGLMVVPQALAYARIAGLPLEVR